MKNNKETFKCPYCDKTYKTERTLNQHINVYCKMKDADITIVGETSKEHIESFQKEVNFVDDIEADVLEKQSKGEEIKKPNDEYVEMVTEAIILNQVVVDLENRLIKFYENEDLNNIVMAKDRMKEFRSLYLEYYNRAMLKTCVNGIVHEYKTLYYVTLKIMKENE